MKLTDLRGILHYVPQFREKTFVLAIDGGIVTDDNFATLLVDVALLRSLSIRVVLVHGAAAQIQALAAERGVVASNLDGTGVTDAATLDLALTAANRLTHEILEGLSAIDLRAASTNVIIAHPVGVIQGVDQLFTGRVERIDVEFLQSLLAQGVVPIVPPLGFDGDGKTYRVDSDGMAVAVAEQLKAVKLIFVTAQPGLLYRGQPIRQMLVGELAALLQNDLRRVRPRDDFEGQARAAGLSCGCPARARHRRHARRGPARRGLLESRPRHADPHERVPVHPPGAEEGRPCHPVAHASGDGSRRTAQEEQEHDRTEHRQLLHLRDRQESRCVRRPGLLSGQEKASWPVFMSVRRTRTRPSAGS